MNLLENNINFEYAVQTLENIVTRLEEGKESLEGTIRLYKEGMTLIDRCKCKLNEAEKVLEDEEIAR